MEMFPMEIASPWSPDNSWSLRSWNSGHLGRKWPQHGEAGNLGLLLDIKKMKLLYLSVYIIYLCVYVHMYVCRYTYVDIEASPLTEHGN
jgi:hypothetical protein